MNTQIPKVVGLKLKRQSRLLQVNFDDNQSFDISCELLRVYSPSAEVQQHGRPVLVTHKKNVNIKAIEAVGNYAVKLVFDDGHDTGIYSWEVLYRLGSQQTQLWQDYLARLKAKHGSREGLIPMAVQYR